MKPRLRPSTAAVANGLLFLALIAGLCTNASALAAEPDIRVRYRSVDTVYLDAGRLAGLAVGDRLELSRDGEVIALLEVVFVADRSASARPLEQRAEIRSGDLARRLGVARPPQNDEPVATTPEQRAPARPPEPPSPAEPNRRPRTTRISGTVTLGFEHWAAEEEDRSYEQSTARLSLRGRDLGGLPLDLRLRLRRRQIERSGNPGSGLVLSENRDRLYELALRWSPDSGRYQVEVGRLGAGPFAGIGYLDGVSGRLQLAKSWQVGAFYGSRPDLRELGFDSAGTKLGVFSRWAPTERGPWEVFLAGVREEDDAGVSRSFAILETRLGAAGGRWSLLQRAEVDLESSLAGSGEAGSGQLTQLGLYLVGRLAERSRLVVSYDRYDPVLLFEDDFAGPARQFRDLLRQGLRASLRFGREGGLRFSLTGGLREGEGDDESTTSLGFGLGRSRPRGLTWSTDLLAFSNPFTEGALATMRSRWGFSGGHSLGLNLGATAYESLAGDERFSSWARLELWIELPASLFAEAEAELLTGDDAEGQRLLLGLGYRF